MIAAQPSFLHHVPGDTMNPRILLRRLLFVALLLVIAVLWMRPIAAHAQQYVFPCICDYVTVVNERESLEPVTASTRTPDGMQYSVTIPPGATGMLPCSGDVMFYVVVNGVYYPIAYQVVTYIPLGNGKCLVIFITRDAWGCLVVTIRIESCNQVISHPAPVQNPDPAHPAIVMDATPANLK